MLEAEQVGFFVVCSGNHMKRADAINNKKEVDGSYSKRFHTKSQQNY